MAQYLVLLLIYQYLITFIIVIPFGSALKYLLPSNKKDIEAIGPKMNELQQNGNIIQQWINALSDTDMTSRSVKALCKAVSLISRGEEGKFRSSPNSAFY